MKTLYVMCGIPGSGKSTFSRQIADRYNAVRLSLDEMNYVRQFKLIPHVIDVLNEGNSVVADSLYTQKQWRTELLEAVKGIECRRVLICMDTPLDVCVQRNQSRGHPLPDYMVEHLFKKYEKPTLDEGWDEIINVSENWTQNDLYLCTEYSHLFDRKE